MKKNLVPFNYTTQNKVRKVKTTLTFISTPNYYRGLKYISVPRKRICELFYKIYD